MNMPERYQPPSHRRKTPSFSSSLLDSILRSIDNDGGGGLRPQQQQQQLPDHHDLVLLAKPNTKLEQEDAAEHMIPSLQRAIMIDQWIDTHNRNSHITKKSCRKQVSYDFSSTGTTSSETPSTYRSLPNSFTISRDDVVSSNNNNTRRESGKFIKSTKLKAMKIYGDLKKVKQPISPGSRISAFIYSLFASSSSSSSKKKAKIEESMQNFRSLKKSRSVNNNKQQQEDASMTCTASFSRSCMSKKQHSISTNVKRSVRFYPDDQNDTVIIHERRADSTPVPKYERRWFAEKNYNNFVVNVEDDDEDEDEDEDDLFELEIVTAGRAYCRQELPVFETTDLRKIRI